IEVDGEIELAGACAPLDLDERHHAPTAHDEVDLAARSLHPPREDAPSVEPQPPCRGPFTPPAALLGPRAVHRFRLTCREARARGHRAPCGRGRWSWPLAPPPARACRFPAPRAAARRRRTYRQSFRRA